MIKHIVMWRFKGEAEGASSADNMYKARDLLLALKGKIPGLVEIEVGVNFAEGPAAYELVLYSAFESREALGVYADHPEHVKVKDFIGKVASGRAVVDYEV